MKKFIFSLSALAALLLAGSCQRENLEPVEQGGTVTYTVQVPQDIATKTDGDDVFTLHYEVYRKDAKGVLTTLFYEGTKDFNSNGTVDVPLEFVKDQKFKVLFWAQKDAQQAYDIENLISVSLKTLVANDTTAEVFAGSDDVDNCVSAQGGDVVLVRPVAQLNIATTAAGLQLGTERVNPTQSMVIVDGLFDTYNVATGTAGTKALRTYAGPTDDTPNVPGTDFKNDYKLMATNYLGFIHQDGDNVEVTFTIKTSEGDITHTVSNVPVKANYKTNIIGNLISATADYNVTLGAWETEETNVEIWDGKTISTPDFDATTQTWTIDNGAELAWVAAFVNETLPATKSTVPKYDGTHHFVLGKNINLGDNEFTPIGVGGKRFSSTFDGNGHIISNFKITKYTGDQAALFGNLAGTVNIKNLTIQKANIVYPGQGDFYASGLVATAYGNVTIENVIVEKSYISGNNKVAGLLAHDGVVSALTIKNCRVRDCKIESLNTADGGNVGGLVGLLQAGIQHNISNSSVKNTVINAINSSDTGKRANSEFVACVYDNNDLKVVINECEVSGNTFTQNEGVTYVSPFGVFVGGIREQKGGVPTVIVNGVEMVAPGLTKVEDTYWVTSANTLQTALERVAEGETIKLEADLTITEPAYGQNALNFNRAVNCTIDLNGKTLTADTGNSVLRFNLTGSGATSDVTLTLKNGKVVAGANTWCAVMAAGIEDAKAILDLQGVIVENSKPGDLGVKAWENGVVKAKNVTVNSTNCAGGFYALGGEVILDECIVNQSGLYTEPYLSMALAVSSNGKMTVNSGTYKSEPTSAEQGNNQGTSHGSWVAGIMNSGGTMIINGGTFTNGNFGDDALATAARGLLLADTGANLQINGGTFNALKAIVDVTNNLGDASRNPSVTLAGGNFSADPRVSGLYASELISVAEGYVVNVKNGKYEVVKYTPVAKVGTNEYGSIDEAIAAWTNNSTLTLLSDVTLSDVVKLKSTEHHILNLGTYTMTAASGQHAIEITCEGRSSASYALTVNADATNPGGITATGKACIYYKKSGSTKDRPIILINNGVFTGSYSINSTSNGNTNCPQFWINGGVFNNNVNLTKNLLQVTGGTFHGWINCTGDQNAYRQITGGRFKSWQFMTADNDLKFAVGKPARANTDGTVTPAQYNVGCYVDDEGYLVVGGPVITEPGDKFETEPKSYSSWSSYLKYSSAATYGLYYEKK